ncbi:MAG: peptide deformylase [Mailhella sp.]|nr:peptide deformylase [Mailhella sp.]
MLRPVVQYPDPVLAKICEPVAEIDDEVRSLAKDMLDTLVTVGGVGIAAPQIGVLKRMVIIDVSLEKEQDDLPQDFRVFINPVITVLDPKPHEENEGCLSVPDLRAKVKRPRRVALDAMDLEGKPVHIEGEGYYGACMQHETDHLDGKLFIDHISFLKRSLYDKKMKKNRK